MNLIHAIWAKSFTFFAVAGRVLERERRKDREQEKLVVTYHWLGLE